MSHKKGGKGKSQKSAKRAGACVSRAEWTELGLVADLEMYHAKEWAHAVRNYEADPRDFYNAYYFMVLHPANTRRFEMGGKVGAPYSCFAEYLYVMVVKVDPQTKRIETKYNPNWKRNGKGKDRFDKARNTETNVWVEWGPYTEGSRCGGANVPEGQEVTGSSSHDPRCDTGGATFEEAIVNLAHNVYVLYGGQVEVPWDKKLRRRQRW